MPFTVLQCVNKDIIIIIIIIIIINVLYMALHCYNRKTLR